MPYILMLFECMSDIDHLLIFQVGVIL